MSDEVETLPREVVLNAMRRPASFLGTHVGAFVCNVVFTLYAFTFTESLMVLGVALPIHGICWLITKSDPFAFRLIGLKAVHTIETLPNRMFWKASSRDPNGRPRRRIGYPRRSGHAQG
ncbi:MAG: VirB3 family type IV secretion system protein [Flavobacteriaceae bacterium]